MNQALKKLDYPLLLKGARIVDPFNNLDKKLDILIEDCRIKAIDGTIREFSKNTKEINLDGKWICPALIDMHVHLREPGEEYKETILTGTRAAAAGGFNAVCCMPNTNPVNDNPSVTRFIIEKAEKEGFCKVYPIAAITKGQKGESLTEFGDLKEAGAIALSDDGHPVSNANVMRVALEYALGFDTLIISHAEELELSKEGCMNAGPVSTMLGLKGIPSTAEEVAIYRDVRLCAFTGARLHIAHVSTKESVNIIREAKKQGIKVTAETAPHYFSLTHEAVIGYNTNAKMNPPLRSQEDVDAIIEGLRDGTIDVIATDHAPHSELEKDIEFSLAANGIIGLETSIPLSLELVRKGHLSPLELIAKLSLNPYKILNLSPLPLSVGEIANFVIIDPDLEFKVSKENLHGKSYNSPFLGKTLRGRAIVTVCNSFVTFDLLNLL